MKGPSQRELLLKHLSDGLPHSTPDIQLHVYGGEHLGTANIKARIHELREEGHTIGSWRDKDVQSIWFYQLKDAPRADRKFEWQRVTLPDGTAAMRRVEV